MLVRKIMPTTLLLIAIIMMLALHYLLPVTKIIPPLWNLLGLLPLGVGIYINLWADHAFQHAQTTVKPYETPSTLVVHGVFQITRNPMYLGFILILLSIALLLRSLSPWIVIPIYALLLDGIYIPQEEQMMAEKFGPLWDGYKKYVRRWI
ncbi:MAG: DUF1295 domain-containing protein [Anaerolineales bacterium]|nr:DUF1295 domain-containing protein [Anaerolineales bacterium]